MHAYHTDEGIDVPTEAIGRIIAPLLTNDDVGRIFLIDVAGTPVGYVALCFGYSIEFGGRDAFIDEIFVIESMRDRGIGRAALEQLSQVAQSLGVVAIHLEVAHVNARARTLYARLGFEPRDRYQLMTRRLAADRAG
ncbi:MAG: GNAT family N-acetyltransferase [Gammaproteobacteria bacterium]|nr:GNAT family N-acetyltransferase [Gammaproteobacteria bacterium]